MKKFLIVLFNIALLFLIFACFEYYMFSVENAGNINNKYYFIKKDFNIENFLNSIKIRKPCGLEYNSKKPILIYGCSFAYGYGLNDEENLGYKISEKSKRPVYNYGIAGKGLQHAYYLIKNGDKIAPEPEYIFYVFIEDHYRRMYVKCGRIDDVKYLTYKNVDGNLVENSELSNFMNNSSIILLNIKSLFYNKFFKDKYKREIEDLAELYFVSMKKELKIKYPNAKFIVIDYGMNNNCFLSKKMINRFEKEGIGYININEELDYKLDLDSYKIPKEIDKYRHPSEKAWEEISDFLIKKYEL